MTITSLVTGATGLLGPYVAGALERLGPVYTSARSGAAHPCDLLDKAQITDMLGVVQPDVVVHAAALTDVDGCEREPHLAVALNVTAVQNLASALPTQTKLVYVSTDQVYPDLPGPHREDVPGPVNRYGETKLRGESAALESARALVLRLNFFGPSLVASRASLSDFIIRAMRTAEPFTLFEDVRFNPLHLVTLASTITELIEVDASGVLNLGASTALSKEQFGRKIAIHLGLDDRMARSGTSSELPGRAARPHDLWMSTDQVERVLGRRMPTLEEEIAQL